MRLTALSLLAAVSLLAACETAPDTGANQATATQTAAPAPAPAPAAVSLQDQLRQAAGDRVYFAFDKSDITPEARKILEAQAGWLQKNANVTVTIEGHCDERGTREYNLALGERRANAVKKVLVALGIPANRVSTTSYGKERPVATGHDEASWAQNRRGVTTVN